ncbi:MAG: hypothetical protein CMI27_04920 [Opitutae bacterium]|nr:hypothetical protein [Opitutae bacterium]
MSLPVDRLKNSKSHCLQAIIFVLKSSHSKNSPRWYLGIMHRILSNSISQLKRLALASGLSVAVFLSLPETLQADDAVKLKSSTPFDFDEDGDQDILDADSSDGNLYLLRNSGLNFSKELLLSPNFDADLVGVNDVDDDGDIDIVILDKDMGDFQVIENQGSQNFIPQGWEEIDPFAQSSVDQAFLSDVDQDGDSDLVYSTPNAVGWAKNNGSDGFAVQPSLVSTLPIGALEVEDLDGDGRDDAYFSFNNAMGTTIGFAKNQGSEGFSPMTVNTATGPQVGPFNVSDLEIADLDSDGKNDLVYSSDTSSAIGWLKNNGSDGFLPASTLASGITSVDQIEIADLDNDSDLDIIAASSDSNFKAWLENDGTDGFTPVQLN